MLEAHTGNAHLIEINPRATQVGHLALGPGRDLPAALYAALSGICPPAAPKVTENDTIALFPARVDEGSGERVSALGLSRCSLGRAGVASGLRPQTAPKQGASTLRNKIRLQTLSAVRLPRL